MPEEGLLFQTNFSEGEQQHNVEVYEAQTTASDLHYYCKIDNDIEVALVKNEEGQWIDMEENAPTNLSQAIGPLIDKHTGQIKNYDVDQENSADEGNLVRYDRGVFFKSYVIAGGVYYASFHPEWYAEEDGLDSTGRYLVVLLHPNGMDHFYMIHNGDKWIPSDEHFIIGTDDETETPIEQLIPPVSADNLDWLSETILNHKA